MRCECCGRKLTEDEKQDAIDYGLALCAECEFGFERTAPFHRTVLDVEEVEVQLQLAHAI
jgi:hypothetical protein